jgi:hypothetical protein
MSAPGGFDSNMIEPVVGVPSRVARMMKKVAAAAIEIAITPATMYVNHRFRAAPSLYIDGSSSASNRRSWPVRVIGWGGGAP